MLMIIIFVYYCYQNNQEVWLRLKSYFRQVKHIFLSQYNRDGDRSSSIYRVCRSHYESMRKLRLIIGSLSWAFAFHQLIFRDATERQCERIDLMKQRSIYSLTGLDVDWGKFSSTKVVGELIVRTDQTSLTVREKKMADLTKSSLE